MVERPGDIETDLARHRRSPAFACRCSPPTRMRPLRQQRPSLQQAPPRVGGASDERNSVPSYVPFCIPSFQLGGGEFQVDDMSRSLYILMVREEAMRWRKR